MAITINGTSGITFPNSSIQAYASNMSLLNTTSFSAASTVTVDSVFSSAYTNYLIIVNETAISGNFDLNMQFRTGGTTNTSATYNYYGLYVTSGGTVTGVNSGSNTSANIGNSLDRPNTYTTYVFQPFATANTQINSTSVGGTRYRAIGTDFSATTSFDGFIMTCSSNNHTGTLKVYGLS
jgi:hypothetical protein